MATLNSLLNQIDSATTGISSDLLGFANAAMQFISHDPVPAPSGGYSTIYAFGDSLSDAGNISALTARSVPAAPYDGGRFTNGAVWVQDLAQDLGLPAVKASLTGGNDFAYGGAYTGATAIHSVNPTDLPSQIAQFAAADPHPQANALYTVWAGSNDVLDIANTTTMTPAQQQAAVQTAVGNEVAAIDSLAKHGATDFLVLDVPDLGKTPYEAARPTSQAASTALAQQFDTQLAQELQALGVTDHLRIDLVDTFSILDGVIANPSKYGFTNVTTPVWTGNLTDPHSGTLNATGAAQNGYLFFDNLHPTAQTHALLAEGIAQSMKAVA